MDDNSPSFDALDEIIGKAKDSVKRRTPRGSAPSATKEGGLKMSEILFLPEDQKTLVNFLSRQERARFKDIQQSLGVPRDELLTTLSALKSMGYVSESLQDGEIFYHIKYGTSVSVARSNMPGKLWDALNPDTATFLREVPLLNTLTEEDREFIYKRLKQENFNRNDVIRWQGDPAGTFYLIKRGVVAVTSLSNEGSTKLLAYLEQGNFFGEGGLLTGRPTSATITAFTPVELLALDKDDFYTLLARNSNIAIELARVLAYRLSDSNARLVSRDVKVYLFVGLQIHSGMTTLASSLALKLAAANKDSTAYLELPNRDIPSQFGFPADQAIFTHPGGYQVLNPSLASDIPELAQIALVVDQAIQGYKNLVVCIPWELAGKLEYLVGGAAEIIVVLPDKKEAWEFAADRLQTLRSLIHANKTRLLTVLNRRELNPTDELKSVPVDFELPHMDSIPPLADRRADQLPEPLTKVVDGILESMGITNQIGVYIPTTIGVDQQADTTAQVERTLAFMGDKFGGATYEQVRGVWNSKDVGLVAENIHLVRSFCSQAAMDQHMGAVVDYVESLKKEMQQEAMALEVNQKLMLI